MQNNDLLYEATIKPLERFGFIHPFFDVNTDTVLSTFVALLFIIALSICANFFITHKGLVSKALISYIEMFSEFAQQSLAKPTAGHISFVASLFTFILLCNFTPIIPWLEEPTKDINTTLALALISFFYVQYNSIKINGIKNYFHE